MFPRVLPSALALGFLLFCCLHSSGLSAHADPGASGTNSNLSNATKEFDALQAEDDAAAAEVESWTHGMSSTNAPPELKLRIAKRWEKVRAGYQDFLRRHPDHIPARLAYASFLSDRDEEEAAQKEWEKILELDPRNSDACNSLAGRYAETGDADRAFQLSARAIELKPDPIYYHNYGDVLYVLRQKATNYFKMSEQGIFAKALAMYSNAFRLAPTNYLFGYDYAQTYYSIKPLPFTTASTAWSNTMAATSDPAQIGETRLHLARLATLAGKTAEARSHLS